MLFGGEGDVDCGVGDDEGGLGFLEGLSDNDVVAAETEVLVRVVD